MIFLNYVKQVYFSSSVNTFVDANYFKLYKCESITIYMSLVLPIGEKKIF